MNKLPFLFLLGVLASGSVCSQSLFVGSNTSIFVESQAELYVGGHLIDGSDRQNAGDSPIKLRGKLEVKGNLTNNSPGGSMIAEETDVGTARPIVLLTGGGNQTISGTPVFFHGLEVDKAGGLVILNTNLSLNDNLVLRRGSMNISENVVRLQTTLNRDASIINEDENHRVFGTNGTIVKESRNYSGTVEPGQLGLGLTLPEGAKIEVTRHHGKRSDVADGSINRYYQITELTNNQSPITDIVFEYFDDELAGVPEADLGLYFSNNNGNTWTPYPSIGVSAPQSRVASGLALTKRISNFITLGRRNCVINTPPFDIIAAINSDNSPHTGGTFSANNSSLNICELSDLNLATSSTSYPFYQWTRNSSEFLTNNITFDSTAISRSGSGNYNLFVRNARGCEQTKDLQVNVRSNPVSDFLVTPNNEVGNRICRDHVLRFDASASSAADGSSIVRYQWDFDLMNDDPTESSFDHVATTTHSYPFEDLYFPTVTVTSEYQCTSFDVDEDIDTLAILDPPAFTGLTIRDFDGALISEECERDIVTFATGAEYRDNTPGRPSPGNLNPPDNDTDLSFSLIYDWDYDDGTTYTDNALSDTSTVTHPFTFRTSNQFTTTVEVRDSGPSFSCSSVTSIPLIVHPLPDASYDVLFEGDNTIVPGSACEGIYLQYENTSSIRQGLFDPSNLASYSWLFGDDSTSTDTSPRHEYLKEGDYDIQLVATSTEGCVSDTTTYPITVHPAPDGALFQDVYASPDSICVGESTTFVNQTTIPTGTVNYDWDFGDGVTSTDISPTHTYSAGGTYRARLQRTSDQGCTNSISPIFVQVNALPAANFSFADPCEGEPTQFFNSSFVQGAAMDRTFSWAFNDGTNSHLSDPLRTFSPSSFDASGQAFFDVSLTVTTHASTTACSDTETKRLTVNRRPTFDFGPVILSAGDTLLNPNNDVQSFLPAGSDYQWTDVLGNPLSNNEALTVTASGTYQLSVQTPNPALCDSTFSIPVFILGAIDLGADRTICVDEVLVASPTVANSISPSSYAWYKDGIPIDGENSVQLFVNATGVYTVEATYELLGESAITRGEVMINRVAEGSGDPSCDSRLFPTVNLGPDVFSCEPSVTFHAGNPGSTYRWSNGSTNPTLTVTESGEYTVTVTGANGNQSSDNVLVEFLSNPKPILGDDFEACDRTSLSAGREASTYQWSTGAETPSIDVTRTGEYWVQTVAENLCVNSDTVHVTIREIPVFELGSDTVVCEGESITLSVDVPGTYAWSTGERTPSIEVDTSAIYSLVVTSEYGCTYEDSRQTTFNPKPVLSLLDAYEACDSIDLIAGSETYSYTWLDGTTGPTLSVSTTGEYSVTATTAQGCEETLTTDVTVFPSPSPALRGSTFEACFGEVVTLDVGDENATYDLNWNTGSTARNLAASASGIYQVRVTSDAGCSILDSAEVIIREAIPLDLAPLAPFCGEGLTEISSGLVGDYTYAWSGPNGQSGNDSFFSPDTTGVYVLTVRDGFGCLAQDSVELFVSNQRVEASFLIPSNVIQGDVVHFIALTGANDNLTYFWDFGDGATSTASDAQYQYTTPGTYAVTLTISNGTCSHSLTKEIVVQDASNRFDGDDSAFGFVEVVVAKSYPNPAVDQIALELEFSRPIAISISIRDIRGYEVARYEAEDFTQETVSFDLAGLRQGMYFFNIQYGKSARNLKFIKR